MCVMLRYVHFNGLASAGLPPLQVVLAVGIIPRLLLLI